MTNKKKITVVIPTKNEGGGIAGLLEKIKPHCDEMLVVDGHSTDDTRELAEKAGARVVLDNKKGKGDGIRVGISQAEGDIIVFIDADGSHDPDDIPKLVAPIISDGPDMVIGSRNKGGSDEFKMDVENLIRQVGSDLATTAVNYRWHSDLTDIQNGFRAATREMLRDLDMNAVDFDIEEEMVMKALKKKYRVDEVASHEYERKWGKSKLATSKGWKFILRLIREMLF